MRRAARPARLADLPWAQPRPGPQHVEVDGLDPVQHAQVDRRAPRGSPGASAGPRAAAASWVSANRPRARSTSPASSARKPGVAAPRAPRRPRPVRAGTGGRAPSPRRTSRMKLVSWKATPRRANSSLAPGRAEQRRHDPAHRAGAAVAYSARAPRGSRSVPGRSPPASSAYRCAARPAAGRGGRRRRPARPPPDARVPPAQTVRAARPPAHRARRGGPPGRRPVRTVDDLVGRADEPVQGVDRGPHVARQPARRPVVGRVVAALHAGTRDIRCAQPGSRDVSVPRFGCAAEWHGDGRPPRSRPDLVTGKGGVGRSTVAGALGLVDRRRGRRTILCEVGRAGPPLTYLRQRDRSTDEETGWPTGCGESRSTPTGRPARLAGRAARARACSAACC